MVHEIIPSTNIKLEDIRDTLNANNGNVTNVLGTFFSSAAKINKWAKFKPVSYKGDFPTGGVQWKGDANSTLWGMCVSVLNNAQSQNGGKEVYDKPLNSDYNYKYDNPTGGTDSPYRLQDFCGYYPKATGISVPVNSEGTKVIYISNTTESVTVSFSASCSTHANAVKFSDIEGVAQLSPEYYLRLVASVYKKGTDTLIAEYFNTSIKLYDDRQGGYNSLYDKDGSKIVDIVFEKTKYWGASISSVDVYLSLQTIKKEITPNGNFFHADKIIALPFTYLSDIKRSYVFSIVTRHIRAMKFHSGDDGKKRIWTTISSTNPIRYSGSGTPDIMFEVSKMPNEVLRFDSNCYLRSKYVKRDGSTTSMSGYVIDSNGNKLSYQEIPTGTDNLPVDMYYHFGDMLSDYYYNGNKLPSGVYNFDIYLVKVSGSTVTETQVANIGLYIDVY